MDISLKSHSEILAWASVFRILGFKLSIPVWEIIGIPKEIVNEPKHILEIAEFFFTRGEGMLLKKRLTSEEVANHFEAHRMVSLGYLYNSFGRIVAYYREENAIRLYEWGERHFVHEKKVFWGIWYSIFLKVLRNKVSVETFLAENDFKQILEIIKAQFDQTVRKEEKLKIEFEKMCQKYVLDPEERNILNKLMNYDLTAETSFDNAADELDFVFCFELLLSQDCAYKIWHLINTNFDRKVRGELFQWGVEFHSSEVDSDTKLNLVYFDTNSEDYFLSV